MPRSVQRIRWPTTGIAFMRLVGGSRHTLDSIGSSVKLTNRLTSTATVTVMPNGWKNRPTMPPMKAITESVRTRMRPIFMTTLTTLGGGLPLVIAPGAGSEMYRGLGAVVVGGLLVSTIFTLVLVPMVLSLVMQMSQGFRGALGLTAREQDRVSPRLATQRAPAMVNGNGTGA